MINLKSLVLSIAFVLMLVIAGYAQSSTGKKNKNSNDTAIIGDETYHPIFVFYYTCPIHTKVRLDKAGNCPQCGMTLDKKKEINYYSCPNHTEVKQDKKGKCEKCGTNLEIKE
ncbi:MAG: hypothetical protein H0W84_03875 [Bacteroidetes bacterium]|nr:hypothetical protein [Bacteroidota bacterium]